MTTANWKKPCALLLVLALGLGAATAVSARSDKKKAKPTKKNVVTVMVDLKRLLQESTLAKKLAAELQAWQEAKKVQVQPKLDDLKQKQADYKAQEASMAKDLKDKKLKDIEALRQELQQLQAEAQMEFQSRENEAGMKFRAKYDPILAALADENGWDLVLNKNDQNALWASDALDQTDLILDRLNEATAEAAAPPTPPAS